MRSSESLSTSTPSSNSDQDRENLIEDTSAMGGGVNSVSSGSLSWASLSASLGLMNLPFGTRLSVDLAVFERLSHFFRLCVRLRGFRGLGRVLGAIIRGEFNENVVLNEFLDEDLRKWTFD